MKHADFINQIEDPRILAAIAAAEAQTTGEIRVFVSRRKWPDPTAAAAKHFKALGMTNTKNRNAVFIFIAPASQTFAIYGDTAIHAKAGEDFWKAVRDAMQSHLKQSHYTAALLHAIEHTGKLLAQHFPAAKGDNPDEQSNTILRD